MKSAAQISSQLSGSQLTGD